jgi:hypothetical protein
MFSVFGQQGTSVVRAIADGDYNSTAFIQSIIIIILGGLVVITTVVLVRRTIKKLKAAGRTATVPSELAGTGRAYLCVSCRASLLLQLRLVSRFRQSTSL